MGEYDEKFRVQVHKSDWIFHGPKTASSYQEPKEVIPTSILAHTKMKFGEREAKPNQSWKRNTAWPNRISLSAKHNNLSRRRICVVVLCLAGSPLIIVAMQSATSSGDCSSQVNPPWIHGLAEGKSVNHCSGDFRSVPGRLFADGWMRSIATTPYSARRTAKSANQICYSNKVRLLFTRHNLLCFCCLCFNKSDKPDRS